MRCSGRKLTIHSPCVSLIARLSIFTSVSALESDPTWWISNTENWVLAEYCSGLICASMIHLKPLVKMLLPFLLGDTREHSKDVEPALPRFRNRTYFQLSQRFEREYGYVSRSWISARSRSTASGVTTEINGMIKVTTELEIEEDCNRQPREPDRVLTWPPKDCERPEAILLRHTYPV